MFFDWFEDRWVRDAYFLSDSGKRNTDQCDWKDNELHVSHRIFP